MTIADVSAGSGKSPLTFLSIASGPGIGLATARRFGRGGYRVVLAARNVARLQADAAKLRAEGVEATAVQVDASDARSVAAVVASIGPDLGVLHYNAGILHYDSAGKLQTRSLADESVDSLVSDTKVNVSSALAAIHAAVPTMTTQGRGTVLVTGGGLGVQPTADFLTLSVGKAGARAIVLALFPALKERGVHVATVTVAKLVSPDSRESEEVAEAFWQLHAQRPTEWRAEIVYQ
ncbi:MAG TPA: SDR family NAD(P)-dependent oxidoreductase [Steroidobacter sp.]